MLEVIGAGFGRTGTLSLKVALERLGFGPCHHAVEIMKHPDQQARWAGIQHDEAEAIDWDAVYAGYRSTVDFPGAAYWRELAKAYPDARVVLTVRDPHEWYASVSNTFLESGGPAGAEDLLTRSGHSAEEAAEFATGMADMMGDFAGQLADEDTAITAFEQHNTAVQEYLSPDRLLVFEVAAGWQPLCDFLGVAVPSGEEFPRLNDSEAFDELIPELIRPEE